jgi:ribosome recycling factor
LHKDLRDFEHEKMISEDELSTGEEELQKLTDKMIEEVDEHSQKKEKDILEV